MQWVGNSRSPARNVARRLSQGRAERRELTGRAGWIGIEGLRLQEFESGGVIDGRRGAHEIPRSRALTVGSPSQAPRRDPNCRIKRLVDCALALIALIVLSPVLAAVAFAVAVDSPGPMLFSQWRGGHNGRRFQILKFRTMTCMEDGSHIRQARKDDARVTRVGRILRKTSLDELPQLINVLRGDMSIVGPRPHALAHDAVYSGLIRGYADRQLVKPGMTGWAQVNGCRGETRDVAAMERRIGRDLQYIRHWSLWLDFVIMARTVNELVHSNNAY